MVGNTPFLNDLAKLAGNAAGSMLEAKNELERMISQQLETLLRKMNLTTKEEMDALRAELKTLREEHAATKARLAQLEGKTGS